MIKGACNCGQVAFEIDAEVKDIYMCHCSICRRASGVQGMAVMVVPKTQFRWLQGQAQISTWKKPGHDWQTWFCSTCGSTLPGDNDDERLYVPAGLVSEGADSLRVKQHIFVDSKAGWFEIGDDAKQDTEAYTG